MAMNGINGSEIKGECFPASVDSEVKDECIQIDSFPKYSGLKDELKTIENDTTTSIKIFLQINGNPTQVKEARELISKSFKVAEIQKTDIQNLTNNLNVIKKELNAINTTNQEMKTILETIEDKTYDTDVNTRLIQRQLVNNMELISDVDLDAFIRSSEYTNISTTNQNIYNGFNTKSTHEPLFIACRIGRVDVVHKLLQKGRSSNAKDCRNWTPLHYSSFYGHLNVVQYLIHINASINNSTLQNETPLILASAQGHKIIVEYLCCHKAKVNCQTSNNQTALTSATGHDKDDIIEILKKYGAKT